MNKIDFDLNPMGAKRQGEMVKILQEFEKEKVMFDFIMFFRIVLHVFTKLKNVFKSLDRPPKTPGAWERCSKKNFKVAEKK